MALLIGIDVGGTNLRLGVVECGQSKDLTSFKLIEEIRFQANFSEICKKNLNASDKAWQLILEVIAKAVQIVQLKYPEISAVGIGFPGFVDPTTKKILQSPNLPGLYDVDLSTDLADMITLPVVTENDAVVAAFGEYSATSAQIDNLIYLGLGTGVGGGMIINGQPFQGQHGVAMEVGHITVIPDGRKCGCGNYGCLEQYASASGVALSYYENTQIYCSAEEIAARARQGDINANQAYTLAGKSLAQALAHVLKVIDIPHVVIGGGMSAGWELMQNAFNKQLDADLIPVLRGKVRVILSTMGDQAGIIGAAKLAQAKLGI